MRVACSSVDGGPSQGAGAWGVRAGSPLCIARLLCGLQAAGQRGPGLETRLRRTSSRLQDRNEIIATECAAGTRLSAWPGAGAPEACCSPVPCARRHRTTWGSAVGGRRCERGVRGLLWSPAAPSPARLPSALPRPGRWHLTGGVLHAAVLDSLRWLHPWPLLLGRLDLQVTRPGMGLGRGPLHRQLPHRSFCPLASFAGSGQGACKTRADGDVPEACPVHGTVVSGRGRGMKDASRSSRVVSLASIPRKSS